MWDDEDGNQNENHADGDDGDADDLNHHDDAFRYVDDVQS